MAEEFDKEKYENRYKWSNHMRGMVLGILLPVLYYEVIADQCSSFY